MSRERFRLFVYGELRSPGLLQEQLGRVPPLCAAVARGYRRRRNPETGHFEAVPSPGGRVPGLLVEDLRRGDLQILDRFEGVARGLYERSRTDVEIVGRTRESVEAEIYVAGPDAGH